MVIKFDRVRPLLQNLRATARKSTLHARDSWKNSGFSLKNKTHRYSAIFGAAIFCIVAMGIATRVRSNTDLREWTKAQAIPTVAVQFPEVKALAPKLTLPGRLEAFNRAPIFARVNGYLKDWKVDIGATVKAGQLLAEIDAPDLDQQLAQARADVLNSQAAAKLSDATLKRRQTLLSQNVASQQDVDERTADLSSKKAMVLANTANVDRLEALAGYKKITAPFDGIITARNTDIGQLINSGAGTSPLFVVSETAKLRIYVDVPQTFVPSIKIGSKASITVPERPNESFPATVEFSARSVDASSGTTRMQMIVENSKGELLPGSFANVTIDLSHDSQSLHIPASALIFDQHGLRVAVVDDRNRISFHKVTIARDLGRNIEIGSGLASKDKVVVTPPDGIADGDEVRVIDRTKNNKPPPVATEEKNTKG
jgi:RND family efflux transporter MFP subunit